MSQNAVLTYKREKGEAHNENTVLIMTWVGTFFSNTKAYVYPQTSTTSSPPPHNTPTFFITPLVTVDILNTSLHAQTGKNVQHVLSLI